MKSVLISIKPKWCELIADGKKTIEVRKTRPTIKTPFKCYIYETASKYRKGTGIYSETQSGKYELVMPGAMGRGKVIGEFICDKIICCQAYEDESDERHLTNLGFINEKGICLSRNELYDYIAKPNAKVGEMSIGWLWHISELKIYDKPKDLDEFIKEKTNCFEMPCQCCKFYHEEKDGLFDCDNILTRPPQSWQYVEELEEKR